MADFGIAHIDEDYQIENDKTPEIHKLRNRDYWAPEQGSPGEDHKVDQFALGYIIFEMLMSELPRGTGEKICEKLEEFDPLMDDIVNRLISRACNDRFESLSALRDLLV